MSNDGSNLGIDAERALETILGGKPAPAGDEIKDRAATLQRIAQAIRLQDLRMQVEERGGEKVEVIYHKLKEIDLGYGQSTDVTTRAILDFLAVNPEMVDAPMNDEYDPNFDWATYDGSNKPAVVRKGLYELMKEDGYDLNILGLTGFMWGFAYNQARWLRYEWQKVGGNPAILEIGGDS